ncbi:MAG: hypothetical protein VX083_06100 [Pseudomonadota bacterium]|jgi:hypothetical protein|nr:hypothetical protein [Pseudomonadota bacterium]MEC8041591.1 hypothetical protein [Pseudomonadota bacterium]MEC8293047.1 hypothetical protein [Pseudomonadota bacterium]
MKEKDRREKEKRLAGVCVQFERNLVFFRFTSDFLKHPAHSEFIRTCAGSMLDVAVLEWCKMFADKNGKHHYTRVLKCKDFEGSLLESLGHSADEFEDYTVNLKHARDKMIAHLDNYDLVNIPDLRLAERAVDFLYGALLKQIPPEAMPDELPESMSEYRLLCKRQAQDFFSELEW